MLRVWWWSENSRRYWWLPRRKQEENFGDFLAYYIASKLTSQPVIFTDLNHPFAKEIMMITGSVLHFANKKSTVWGCGIIERNSQVKAGNFRAVRGPFSRKRLQEQGFSVPEVYGDPAILLPLLYPKNKTVPKYNLGIIPHYTDYETVKATYANFPEIKVISLLNSDIEAVIDEINDCKKILSSSLHGVIVAHAYSIPAVWVKFSDNLAGDGIKFQDYFASLDFTQEKAIVLKENIKDKNELLAIFDTKNWLIQPKNLAQLQLALLQNCPFAEQDLKAKVLERIAY